MPYTSLYPDAGEVGHTHLPHIDSEQGVGWFAVTAVTNRAAHSIVASDQLKYSSVLP